MPCLLSLLIKYSNIYYYILCSYSCSITPRIYSKYISWYETTHAPSSSPRLEANMSLFTANSLKYFNLYACFWFSFILKATYFILILCITPTVMISNILLSSELFEIYPVECLYWMKLEVAACWLVENP